MISFTRKVEFLLSFLDSFPGTDEGFEFMDKTQIKFAYKPQNASIAVVLNEKYKVELYMDFSVLQEDELSKMEEVQGRWYGMKSEAPLSEVADFRMEIINSDSDLIRIWEGEHDSWLQQSNGEVYTPRNLDPDGFGYLGDFVFDTPSNYT